MPYIIINVLVLPFLACCVGGVPRFVTASQLVGRSPTRRQRTIGGRPTSDECAYDGWGESRRHAASWQCGRSHVSWQCGHSHVGLSFLPGAADFRSSKQCSNEFKGRLVGRPRQTYSS